jgi:hypothetical protein
MAKIYNQESTPSNLEMCIRILHAVKILAGQHISNPFGQLEEPEQELIDNATSAIDEALQKFEALMNMWRSHQEEN